MLINVGEAYIVVNLLQGNMINQDSDLLLYHQTENHEASENQVQSVHVEKGFEEDLDDDGIRLKLKIFGGPSAGEIYFYKPELNKNIIIGRTPDCEIRINDKLLSKN